MHLRSALRVPGFLVALFVSIGAVAIFGARLDRQPQQAGVDGHLIYLPKAKYLRPMSLGYHNVLADLLWFRTISYFGEHYKSDRTYPWLAYMCDLVTDLDRRAEHVYRFGGLVLPWEAGQVDEGIRLLSKGIEALPESWQLHYYLGFAYYFFKDDYGRAVRYMRRAAELPGTHPATARLAAVLGAEQFGPETTLRFLADLEQNVDSEQIRAVVRKNMREAQLAADLSRLGTAVEEYRARQHHSPASIEELVEAGLLTAVPSDPFGGTYRIDPRTGEVSSSTGRQPSRLYESKLRKKVLEGKPGRELLDR